MKKGCIWAIGIVVLLGVFSVMFSDSDDPQEGIQNKEALANSGTSEDSANVASSMNEQAQNIKTWKETESIDEMTEDRNIWKSITSDNSVDFEFPYNGGSTLTISVRYMKKYGTDVLLQISNGQILCNEYNGTNYATIKFDDEAPIKFTYTDSNDGSADIVFLKNTSKFISKAKKAKQIKVQLPFFQEGQKTFKFYVDEPLQWE